MKKLMLVLGLVGLSQAANAMNCYSFQPNSEGYSQLCVDYTKPGELNSPASVVITQGPMTVYSMTTERKYYPKRTILVGKEHDPKTFPQTLAINERIDNASVKIDLNLYFWTAAPEKCKYGTVAIREPGKYTELTLQCSKTWW